MLYGWHANNGVLLGNPRLGFACTGQTVDGQPGLEGYYFEAAHDLAPDQRLRFALGERCPVVDPSAAPVLDPAAWPEARLRKVMRNYAMDYITSIVPETIAVLGAAEGGHLAGLSARLIGMQFFAGAAAALGGIAPNAEGFARFLARIPRGQGNDAVVVKSGPGWEVRQTTWTLMRERASVTPEVFDAWTQLFTGAAAACDRALTLDIVQRRDRGHAVWAWRITRQ